MGVDVQTKLCGVIGHPIGHTLSPAIHNAAFSALDLNFIYLAFDVADVGTVIQGMRGLGIRGLSVTIPHKLAAYDLADEIDPVAASIGSVNTLVNDDGVIKGYNTDGIGALRALEESGVKLDGAEVTLLGSGGSARAIACTIAMRTDITRLNILGVEKDQVKALSGHVAKMTSAKVIGEELVPDTLRKALQTSHVLVHATPVGMHPKVEESLVPKSDLVSPLVVFDIVYNPLRTRLLEEAQENRCRAVSGVEMFIQQAVTQFELFTGSAAPEKVMRKVVMDRLRG